MAKRKSSAKSASSVNGGGSGSFVQLPMTLIDTPRETMRGGMSTELMNELKESISQIGLINPITVVQVGKRYEIKAGHRRYIALKMLNSKTALCRIIHVSADRADVVKVHENYHREAVNPIEEAAYIRDVMEKKNLSQRELSKYIGRSESYVADRVAAFEWPMDLRDAVNEGRLAFSAARELARIKDERVRSEYIGHAIKTGITPQLAKQWAQDANAVQDNEPQSENGDNGAVSAAPREYPKFDCFGCRQPTDVREARVVRCCPSCYETLSKAQSDAPPSASASS